MIHYKDGSLLDASEQYVCHQLNASSTESLGLAKDIFEKYSYSDVYKDRQEPDELGSIIISGEDFQRKVIGLVAQRYPGKPKYANDTQSLRQKWFKECIDKIYEIENLESIAFPHKIGCGLAGGSWDNYLKIIRIKSEERPDIKISIYKL